MKYLCKKDYYLFDNKILDKNQIIDVIDNNYHHIIDDVNKITINNIDKLDEFEIYTETDRNIQIIEDEDEIEKLFTLSLTIKCKKSKLIEVQQTIDNTLSLLNL